MRTTLAFRFRRRALCQGGCSRFKHILPLDKDALIRQSKVSISWKEPSPCAICYSKPRAQKLLNMKSPEGHFIRDVTYRCGAVYRSY